MPDDGDAGRAVAVGPDPGDRVFEGGQPEPAPPAVAGDPAPRVVPDGMGRHRAPGPAVRWNPGRRGLWALCATAVLAAVLLLAFTWLDRPRVTPAPARSAGTASAVSMPPPRAPTVGEAAATSATVVVSVVGLVARPGLQTLSRGARVADAVAAAGGLLPQADPASINLAALVADGQQIAVGVPGASTGAPAAGGGAAVPGAAPAGPVDLNTATVAQLDALAGIGPVLAQRIVDYREQHGRFASVDQLDDVPGIGPALYARLKPLVTV